MTFRIFAVMLFLAALSPSIYSGSSMRLDTILIAPILIAIGYIERHRLIHKSLYFLAFMLFVQVLGAWIPVFVSTFRDNHEISSEMIRYLFGNTRGLMMFALAAICVRTQKHVAIASMILGLAAVFHGIVALIEYNQIKPFDQWLLSAFNSEGFRIGTRAVGIFPTIHSLAFFGMYVAGLSFTLAVGKRTRGVGLVCLAGSLVCATIPFSRAANLGLLSMGLVTLLYASGRIKTIGATLLVAFSLMVFPFLPIRFQLAFSSLYALVGVATGTVQLNSPDAGFITGRLDFGWKNALELWKEYPFFGAGIAEKTLFLGDGFFTSQLAYVGIVGLGLWIVGYCGIFYWFVTVKVQKRDWAARCARGAGVGVLVASGIAGTATGYLQFRTIEIFPVILLLLAVKTLPSTITSSKAL